ncbi:hypothetical protein [Polyangium mundeleinium]|uniref:Uncharacterized protein n=1 Tax=Polyangium mundeleinium TaxID=2995306 RepID=A0ABT5F039_9BACT|nr:hypothetical protein [Polyangium mundeleinium]MDC0746532.1 hypothetical protein [Polyangium mundeleinium]
MLVRAEITSAAAGDIDAARIAHDAVSKLFLLVPDDDEATAAARDAHSAASKLLGAMSTAPTARKKR